MSTKKESGLYDATIHHMTSLKVCAVQKGEGKTTETTGGENRFRKGEEENDRIHDCGGLGRYDDKKKNSNTVSGGKKQGVVTKGRILRSYRGDTIAKLGKRMPHTNGRKKPLPNGRIVRTKKEEEKAQAVQHESFAKGDAWRHGTVRKKECCFQRNSRTKKKGKGGGTKFLGFCSLFWGNLRNKKGDANQNAMTFLA